MKLPFRKIILFWTIFFTLASVGFSENKVKKALVLSGGGARAFAHIGVLKALEEIGFYPDLIVGTSIGAMIGALYAGGNSPNEIEEYVRNTKWTRVLVAKPYREIELSVQKMLDLPELFNLRFDENFNVVFPRNLISTQALQDRIFQMLVYPEFGAKGDFDSLAIPLRIVASDLKSGKTVVIRKGNLAKAVTASSAFPILLAPVKQDTMLLVDGGITNNVPCDIARDAGADFVIAVDVTSKISSLNPNFDILDVFGQAMNTLAYFSDTRNLIYADVLIQPDLGNLSSADFDSLNKFVQLGYEAVQGVKEKIMPYAQEHNLRDTTFLKRAMSGLDSAKIAKISFSGNRVTREFVMKKELLLKEGDFWNTTLARRSLRNLFSTGLFKNVYLSPLPLKDDKIELKIEVEEEERNLFSFGARYDNERKASAFWGFKYRNLFGAGIDNQVYMVVSDLQNKLEWNIRVPRIATTNFMGYATAYYRSETVPQYEPNRRKRLDDGKFSRSGFDFNAGLLVKRVGLTAFGFKTESVRIFETENPPIPKQNYTLFGLTFRIFVDNTDNIDLPRTGRVNDFRLEHNFIKDSRKHFDRLYFESTNYEALNEKTVFHTQMKIGLLNREQSKFELFRLGGLYSMPGLHQDELWGKLLISFNAGFRYQLGYGLYFQAKTYVGNLWKDWGDFNWRDSQVGSSVGLVVASPLGPMAIDWGYNFYFHCHHIYVNLGHYF